MITLRGSTSKLVKGFEWYVYCLLIEKNSQKALHIYKIIILSQLGFVFFRHLGILIKEINNKGKYNILTIINALTIIMINPIRIQIRKNKLA